MRKGSVPAKDFNYKESVQIVITVVVVATYCLLTITDKIPPDGFVLLAGYVIKKFLDIMEENNGGSK